MSKIITAEQIKDYKDIGQKIDKDKINPIISQAQDVDLRNYLGARFYFDVIANLESATYQDLLSGSTFMMEGVSYHHEGIRAMLADLFMARYIPQVNTNLTPFGATVKGSNDSEPADRNSLKDLAHGQKEMAGSKWEIIQLYLSQNRTQFPHYNTSSDCDIATGRRRLKFSRI